MKPIKTKDDHQAALSRIEQLWDANPNTPEGEELEALITNVEVYEEESYPIAPPTDLYEDAGINIQEALLSRLQTIESNMRGHPTLSPIDALQILNVPCHNAQEAKTSITEQAHLQTLLVFNFGNKESMCIPAFQFDPENHRVLPIIPTIAKLLHPLSDWGVATWFMTYDDDLGMTPMEAVLDVEKADTLIDLAGLYSNKCTLRNLKNSS
ncbi:hypothetical protein LRP50_00030 [Enterovibrio sp. ZSDZ42]|uniref:Uncharacterized protein n=1 Tax=Enterovibrio gelatinilyticus TaxID=2899819 RepID=A0ABT5QU33_9GAMM|nr:hypothetical protein [Enterovibrio sp. ZSDZ42]MDD1791518.1 hypothetical protein [Enterovibrio sp. ZSDZ42]